MKNEESFKEKNKDKTRKKIKIILKRKNSKIIFWNAMKHEPHCHTTY